MKENTKNIIPTLHDLLKLEHLVASSGFSLLPKQPVHSVLSGKHASKLRGRGLDFEEVRKYVAGDDIRNIDWRVTARTRITSTKVFTEEKEKPVLAITDMTSGMFFGSQVYTKSFIASQLAAISAFKVLKNGDRFGGLVFNNEGCKVFAPQRSRKVVLQYLQQLVEETQNLAHRNKKIQPKAEVLENALRRTLSIATHDYLIIVISDFYDISPKAKKHLIQLSKHNDVILARITDPLEEKLPKQKLVLSDGDLQLLWEAGKKQSGKKYENSYSETKASFFQNMEKYGIPVMQLSTVDPIDIQLKSLFKSKLKAKKR
ncbi:DUF58 domain-containing protein [Draconibacterium sp.]|nr:DUF58 domain-containing protein [Draconibacterium sp.]